MTNPKEWEDYLERRYNAKFDKNGVALVANAAAQAANQAPDDPVNTRDFLPAIVKTTKILTSLVIESSMTVVFGEDRPDHEDVCQRDIDEPPKSPFPNFTQCVEDALLRAVKLATQTSDYKSVNAWHIAAEVLMSDGAGIETALAEGGTSSLEAVRVISRNVQKLETGLANANGQAFLNRLHEFIEIVEERARGPLVEPQGEGIAPGSSGGKSFDDASSDISKKMGLPSVVGGGQDPPEPPDVDTGADESMPYGISYAEALSRFGSSPQIAAFLGHLYGENYPEVVYGSITPESLFHFLHDWSFAAQGDIARYFAKIVAESDSETLDQALDKVLPFVGSKPEPFLLSETVALFEVGQKIAEDLDSDFGINHLLAAVLLHSRGGLPEGEWIAEIVGEPVRTLHLEFLKYIESLPSLGDYADWEALFPKHSRPELGGYSQDSREATADELGIGIEELSDSLQTLFETTPVDTDLIFALYGPWGRGKTTLMNEVRRKLTLHADDKYAFVDFSAWKYPTRPEVWVHLYETIAEQAASVDGRTGDKEEKRKARRRKRLQELRVGFRCGLLKTGWGPLYVMTICLALLLIPALDTFSWIKGILGLSGIAALLTFLGKATNLGRSFAQRYLALPDHSSQLGMQAVIGKDLDDLLRIWITPKKGDEEPINKFWGWRGFWRYWGLPLILIGVTLIPTIPGKDDNKPVKEIVSYKSVSEFSLGEPFTPEAIERASKNKPIVEITRTLEPRQEKEGDHKSGKTTVWITKDRITLLTFAAGFLIFGLCISWRTERKEKLLLVIDDLDRCRPDQMLSVIESLRLFLDNPGMKSRLQIAMLVDDRLLGHALLRRAKEDGIAIEAEKSDGDAEPEGEVTELSELAATYIKEQREKLFLAELALSKLSQKHLDEIALKYVPDNPKAAGADEDEKGGGNSAQKGRKTITIPGDSENSNDPFSERGGDNDPPTDGNGGDDGGNEESKINTANSAETGSEKRDQEKERSEERFHDNEIEPLRTAISSMAVYKPTPRQIRTFLARYQLARLILENQGVKPEIPDLIKGIAGEMGLGDPLDEDGQILQMARSVVCPPSNYTSDSKPTDKTDQNDS